MPAGLLLAALACPAAAVEAPEERPGPRFEVAFDAGVRARPFTGRVLVFLSKELAEPRRWNNWARLEPVLAVDVADLAPGATVRVGGADTLAFPVPLSELEGGTYFAQAVLDADPLAPRPGVAAGNPYSAPARVELVPGEASTHALACDRVDPPAVPVESRTARLFEMRSRLLSEFHGREVVLRALVHLPAAYFEQPERRFPMLLSLSGFGADLADFEFVDWPAPPVDGVPMIVVYPDPRWPTGHCGFADSDVNGPWGAALAQELVPALERAYRGVPEREARFLTGHSTGAWSALWLLFTYPRTFGYAWASSPDPVDFRDFLGVDLYAEGANVFVDAHGAPRPFCRLGDTWTVGYTREYSDRERVLRGGVLGYFEALYGPRAESGGARPLWDRATGAVDPEVAAAWARYDLGRILRERWEELEPLCAGRVVVTMGDRDNFLLRGSVERLRGDLEAIGADVRVRVLPGDHFTVRSSDLFEDETRAMADAYRAWLEGR